MLKTDNINLHLGNFSLKEINLEIEKGDYFVLLGVSGVGKSLLLETLAGLQIPDSGNIFLRGENILYKKIQERKLSIVYQDTILFPHLSVYENIAYPLRSKKSINIKNKVFNAAKITGINDKLDQKPETLSGGEKQRTALARSLCAESDLFLLDEPLSSLDMKSRNELRALLRKLNRDGITIIHVTHDYEEALSLASKIGIMENGRLVHVDIPENIFTHPKSEFIAQFTGIKNYIKGEIISVKGKESKIFRSGETEIFCLTDVNDGHAFLIINPEDINISLSPTSSSERNHLPGIITDIVPSYRGYEIFINTGRTFIARISKEALNELQLGINKKVWINFKASACRIYN